MIGEVILGGIKRLQESNDCMCRLNDLALSLRLNSGYYGLSHQSIHECAKTWPTSLG